MTSSKITLSAERVAQLRRAASGDGSAREPRRRPHDGPAPLSFAQERLWFLDQLEGAHVHHNDGLLISMHGPADVSALTRGVNEVVQRHQVLRTAFIETGDGPVQQAVTMWPGWEIPLVSAEGLGEERFTALYMADLRRNLDLRSGEAARVTIYRRGPEHHVLIAIVHHLVCDLWSLAIFTEELAELYNAYVAGREPALAALPLQYADYAAWERDTFSRRRLAADRRYWLDTLGGAQPLLSLGAGSLRPVRQGFSGGVHRVSVPPETVVKIRGWSAQQGYTPFMTLLAMFNMLMAAESRSDDIVVSTPVATRTPQLERMIGCFLNVLILRTKLDGIRTFRELAARAREVCLGAYSHQRMPFQQIVQELAPRRERSHAPIAQVALVLQNTPSPVVELSGLRTTWRQLDPRRSRMDLIVKIENGNEGYTILIEYDEALFEPAWIARFGSTFAALMELAVADSDAPLSELTRRAREGLGVRASDLAGPCLDRQPAATITGLFECQAAQSPSAPAVISETGTLSYRELNERANRLARHLRSLGVTAEAPVAVLLPRTAEEIIAIIAVLKAGGTYVPLNPYDPPLRHAAIMSGAKPWVLITAGGRGDAGFDVAGTTVVGLGPDAGIIARHEVGNLLGAPSPKHLAYIMYTSGSTGTPKGVMIGHEGFCERMRWMQEEWPLGGTDRVLRKAACTFDVSMGELFRAVLNGAASVLLPPRAGFDPRLISQTINAYSVTDADFSPTALREILRDEDNVERCRSLRRIISGVEALPPDLAARVHQKLDAALDNFYGPTEASVFCLARHCRPGEARVPLGLPAAGTYIRILDGDLNPVPRGDIGELCVGGVGLARGYLGEPALTADRFVPDPGAPDGARLYRTGDLARIGQDGEVEFHGRRDLQLNLHGYRVEPAEVERQLLGMAELDAAAVAVVADGSGREQLAAFLVLSVPEKEFDRRSVIRRLRAVLPGYMVPTAYRVMPEIPLNAHGKRDVSRLVLADKGDAADQHASTGSGAPVAAWPRDGARKLAAIWRDVLGLDEIDLTDNLLELGGNSLDATRIAIQVREELGRDLDVADIFDYPTVAELSAWLGL